MPPSIFDQKPFDNANKLCPGCGHELVIRRATPIEKEFHSKDLNKRLHLDLEPRDILLVGEPCQCGEGLKVFFKHFTDTT